MTAYKGGTVFIDVVPSMKGFFKDVAGEVKGQMPAVGNEAGRAYASAFQKSAASAGKDVVNAIADPLGKSAGRLRQEAAAAGRALSAAQDAAASSGRALAAAREREASAAADVEAAEAALNRARSSGTASASSVASAEAAYARALNASKAANSAADAAAASHSRNLGAQEKAARAADAANEELAQATGQTKQAAGRADPAMRGLAKAIDDVEDSASGAGSSVDTVGARVSSVGSLARSAMAPLLALGAAVGIGGFASEAIEASDATDKFVSTLQFAGIDTTTIDRLKESAQKYADETVYDLSDIQNVTAQLAANGVENYDKLAEAAGNLNAVAGGNKETFSSVGMVLTQTAGQGKLTTENFNQLSDAIPGASGKIQEALLNAGAYTGNFREALEKGEVTAQEFNDAVLQLGSDEAAQAAARSTKTIEGAAGNLQATIVGGFKDLIDYIKPGVTDLMGSITDSISSSIDWIKSTAAPSLRSVWSILTEGDFTGPIFGLEEDDALVDYLFRLRDAGAAVWDALKSFADAATGVGGALSPLLSAAGDLAGLLAGSLLDALTQLAGWLGDIFDWVGRNSDVVGSLTVAIGAAAVAVYTFNTAQTAMKAINAAGSIMNLVKATNLAKAATAAWNLVMNANPIMLVVTAVAALVAGLVYFFTQTETGRQIWASITEAFQSFINWVATAWSGMLQTVGDWWTSTWSTVKDTFNTWVVQPLATAWASITEGLQSFIDWVGAAWSGMLQTVGDLWSAAWSTVKDTFNTWVVQPLTAAWDAITGAFQTAWNVIQTVWDGIVTAAKVAFAVIVGVVLTPFQVAINVLGDLFTWLWTGVIQPAWDGIGNLVSTVYHGVIEPVWEAFKTALQTVGAAVMGLWSDYIVPAWNGVAGTFTSVYSAVIKPVFDWLVALWNSVAAQAQAIWQGVKDTVAGVWNAIVVVITTVWATIQVAVQTAVGFVSGVVTTAFTAVRDTVSSIWNAISSVISGVWEGIKAAASAAANWVSGTVTGIFTGMKDAVAGVWNAIVVVITTVWATIQVAVQTAVGFVSGVVTTAFTAVRDTVSSIWNAISSVISGVWEGIKTAASAAANWVKDTVTNTFTTLKNSVSNVFSGMKSAVEKVWNGLKAIAAKPINYIIKTVYTNGLKHLVETVASKIGLDLTLPTIAEIGGYAGGGVIPGYDPGHDRVPAVLSPGEAVLVPELVRAIGPARILAANWAYSHRRPGGSPGFPTTGFAGGGVAHYAEGGIVGWFKDVAKGVADFFADPVGSVLELITKPVRALFNGLGTGFIGDLAKGGIEKILTGITDFFKKKTEDGSATAAGGGPGLVGAARRAIGVPYVWGGSSIPPGLDCSGLVYWAAQQLGWGWPRLTAAGYQAASTPVAWGAKVPGDLLFWGAPAHHVAIVSGASTMIEEPRPGLSGREIAIWGSPTVGRYGGARTYDAGGVLPPGVHAAVNATGAPEAVLTARQWADVHALVDRGGADPDALARALDGLGVSLVLDDGAALDAHIEVVASSVARRSRRLAGRGR